MNIEEKIEFKETVKAVRDIVDEVLTPHMKERSATMNEMILRQATIIYLTEKRRND